MLCRSPHLRADRAARKMVCAATVGDCEPGTRCTGRRHGCAGPSTPAAQAGARLQPGRPLWTTAGEALETAASPVLWTRARPRPEKHLLRKEERREVIGGTFAIREGGRVDNLRVLLLDDVMTTGATLAACTRTLEEAGARTVVGLTVARAVRTVSPVAGES